MKKLTFLLVGVLFVGSVFVSGLQQAQALTTDELTSQIQLIQRQIDALRTQLGSINPTSAPTPIPGPIPTPTPIPPLLPGPIPAPPEGGGGGAPAPIFRPIPVPPDFIPLPGIPPPTPTPVPDPGCRVFTQNLRFGMSGSEVADLQVALQKAGFATGDESNEFGVRYFGEKTASAVVGFQQKYASEILTPLGLQYGTGFVGAATRAKLNSLYGCGRISPVPIPTPIPGPTPIPEPAPTPAPILPISSTTGSLSLFVPSDTYPPTTITKGSTNDINLFKYRISAGSAEDVKITSLTVQMSQFANNLYSGISPGDVAKVRLFYYINGNSDILLSTVPSGSFATIFPDLNLIIAKNTTITLRVTVNIPLTSTLTSLVGAIPTEIGNYGVTAYGITSGKQLLSWPDNNIVLTGHAIGSVMTVSAPVVPIPGPIPTPSPTPSITVLSPNGGEVWQKGLAKTISWASSNVTHIIIELRKAPYETTALWIVQSAIPNTGSYQWTIPISIADGSDYKLRVIDVAGLNFDYSDVPFSIVSAASTVPAAPEMVYPVNGQTINYGYPNGYMFKVKPIAGVEGYLFGFFQNGTLVYENWRDDKKLSANGEFAIWPENPLYSKFKEGNVEVWVRALIKNQWSDARVITVKLVAPVIANAACTDSDGGKDYYTAGTTTGRDSYGGNLNRMATYQDKSDANNTRVLEFYCENINDSTGLGYVTMENVPCPYGSANGACLKQAAASNP